MEGDRLVSIGKSLTVTLTLSGTVYLFYLVQYDTF